VGAGGVESSGFGLPQKPAAFFKKICEQKRDAAQGSSVLTGILNFYDNERLGYDDGSCDRRQQPKKVRSVEVEDVEENIRTDESYTNYVEDAMESGTKYGTKVHQHFSPPRLLTRLRLLNSGRRLYCYHRRLSRSKVWGEGHQTPRLKIGTLGAPSTSIWKASILQASVSAGSGSGPEY
jgi:hypothetical protein